MILQSGLGKNVSKITQAQSPSLSTLRPDMVTLHLARMRPSLRGPKATWGPKEKM